MRSLITIQILLIAAICSHVHATIINVPDDFRTIQGAIDHTEAEDTVLVQPGIYEANLRINASLTLASLTLTTGDPAYIDSTVIDGRHSGSVIAISGASPLISGFTIQNGLADEGGGVNCSESNVHLEDMLIIQNESNGNGYGGGIYANNAALFLVRVKLIDNIASTLGGGICAINRSPVSLVSCILLRNRSNGNGGGFYTHHDVSLSHVLIAQNYAGNIGGGAEFTVAGVLSMDHVTFVDNQCRNNNESALYMNLRVREFVNCIVYGNTGDNGSISYFGEDQISVSYCDIEGGIQAFGDVQVDAVEIIDENPLFFEPDSGDYHLQWNSPCIDAGDPDAEPDIDGTRTDLGAFHFLQGGFVHGVVTGGRDHTPLPGATVTTSYGRSAICDSVGFYSFKNSLPDSFSLTASQSGYLDSTKGNFQLFIFDTLEINFDLLQPILQVDEELVSTEVDSGETLTSEATIRNVGEGQLEWRAVACSRADAGFDPWSLRQSLPVSEITADDRIEGVIFDGESYFCAGANGEFPNTFYQVSRDGDLLGSFLQPGHSRYGFKDMEWDGELIWGSGEDTVYAINRDGDVIHRWHAPFNPTNNLAYDPIEAVFWLSGTTTNISAYDRAGNDLGRSINRQGLRVYGLAWYPDDPDSSWLYSLTHTGGDLPPQFNKFNTNTGEMQLVHSFPLDSATGFNGAFICQNFDKYQGWVMTTVVNAPHAFGGDALRVYQLEPNREWFTVDPDSGEIPAGGESQIAVHIHTAGEDNDWAFELGEYEGEIVLTHNGLGGRTILPVRLTVVEPNDVDKWASGQVDKFELAAAYPNPFNARTTLRFDLPAETNVRLTIHDLTGRLVERLVDAHMPSGQHSVVWDGAGLVAGVYLIRLESGGKTRVAKGVIVK